MIRRCKTAVLLLAYLASQVAVLPHAHGAGEVDMPADHDVRPHVHFLGATHSHGHGHPHHHHGEGAAHSHALPVKSEPASDEVPGHDSDAVYLPNELNGPQLRANVADMDGPTENATQGVIVQSAASQSPALSSHSLFSGESRPDQHLYLALRALRI